MPHAPCSPRPCDTAVYNRSGAEPHPQSHPEPLSRKLLNTFLALLTSIILWLKEES